MIGLDTNVLVRYLTQDDPAQSALATRLIESKLSAAEPGYIGLVVLVETAWVLQSLYRATAAELRATIGDLLDSRQLVVEQRAVVAQALATSASSNTEFPDALIAECAMAAGCKKTMTFDRLAVRSGMQLLK